MSNENHSPNTHSLNNDVARYRNSLIDRAEETNFRASQFFRAFNSPTPDIDELRKYAAALSAVLIDFNEKLKPYTDETV